eukprot:208573_1
MTTADTKTSQSNRQSHPGYVNMITQANKYSITQLSTPPFGDEQCGRNVVYVNGQIIISPDEDNHIYKFDMKSKTWSKYKFGNYTNIW